MLHEATLWLAVIVGILGLVISLWDGWDYPVKRPFRVFAAVVFGWMVYLYLQAAINRVSPIPVAARSAFIMLAGVYIAEIVMHRLRRK